MDVCLIQSTCTNIKNQVTDLSHFYLIDKLKKVRSKMCLPTCLLVLGVSGMSRKKLLNNLLHTLVINTLHYILET